MSQRSTIIKQIRKEGNQKADLIELKAKQEANKLLDAAKNK